LAGTALLLRQHLVDRTKHANRCATAALPDTASQENEHTEPDGKHNKGEGKIYTCNHNQ
jgi:hypothetical protein